MNTDKDDETLVLIPAQKVFVFRRDCVRSPREKEKLASSPGGEKVRVRASVGFH